MKKNKDLSENLDKALKALLSEVEKDSNPEALVAFKKAFKKNISIWRRDWVIAYLLKDKFGDFSGDRRSGKGAGNRNKKNQDQDRNQDKNRSREKEEITGNTLWFNIGYNKKLNKKSLSNFLVANSDVDASHILEIRVKQYYSFVIVKTLESAETLIEKINDKEYKGEAIKVDFAKKK